MAIVTRKVSDITGTEAVDHEFASIIVRQHPKVPDAKRLDALPAELDEVKEVGDLVILEVRLPDKNKICECSTWSSWRAEVPDESGWRFDPALVEISWLH